jgi:SAM-dependent methyltransferase
MDNSELKRYTESNRAAWNEVIPYHQRAVKDKWDSLFAKPGYVRLDDVEVELLLAAGLKGKNVAHLCCNNGVELLSLKNLGAGECTGFDISDAAIEEAQGRARACGIDCHFVRSDVYEIGAEYNGRFDMVYITVGCLGWMPDLKMFFAKAAALLRGEGLVFIHETHPFAEMLHTDNPVDAGSLRIFEPYFKVDPYIEQGGLDYVGEANYTASTTQYWFIHTISDILMSLIDNGFAIEYFAEYEAAISPEFRPVEEARAGIPLSYILIGRQQNAH